MSSLRDPLAIARGLGSAKQGSGHWWSQRISSAALLLLSPWFVVFMLGMVGADRFSIQLVLSRPLNASLMIGWVLALFWHAQQGLQVVIEDYVHGRVEIPLQVLVKLLCSLGAIAAVIATLRIVFAA
jgi:succinate dehydrogenase / fumarate reductase, membrane anchor subunit